MSSNGSGKRTTYISFHKLEKVGVPKLKGNRVSKEIDSALVDLVAVLKILVLLQEVGIVDNDLRVGDLELQNLVVNGLGRLYRSNRFLQIHIERPQT